MCTVTLVDYIFDSDKKKYPILSFIFFIREDDITLFEKNNFKIHGLLTLSSTVNNFTSFYFTFCLGFHIMIDEDIFFDSIVRFYKIKDLSKVNLETCKYFSKMSLVIYKHYFLQNNINDDNICKLKILYYIYHFHIFLDESKILKNLSSIFN